VGVDASIANAFRRILIAEVPTIAIEHVYVFNNTSVIQDEVMAQRIGLIPLNVDPSFFEFRKSAADTPTDKNTLVFKLRIACEWNKDVPRGSENQYINELVKSGHLEWEPQGEQALAFSDPPRPTNTEIVLAKLRPGQEIDMELHAIKGVGKDHAKWSPVATATYRLHPLIILNPEKPIPPHLAAKFIKCFSPGVVKLDKNGKITIDQYSMRKESMSREVLRHKEFEGCVELKRIRDWFIFNIESESAYPPERLFPESIRVMREKIANIRTAAEALLADADGALGVDGDVQMAGT